MANSILQGVVSQPVDLAGAFARGQQMYNQNQSAQLDQQRAKQDISEADYQKNVRKVQIANRLAKKAINLPPEGVDQLLNQYSNVLLSVGFTPEDLANTPRDKQGLQALIDQTDSVIQASGKGSESEVQQAQYVEGLGYVQQLRNGQVTMAELSPEQQAKVKQALNAQAGRQAQAYGQKQRAGLLQEADLAPDIEREKTIAKETGAGNIKRTQDYVDRGVTAAEGIPNVRRALSLMDDIQTGGIDKVAIRARQIFGIEGADEGELSYNMGKAVLSQLKDTFGAAFTLKEGERLEQLEAGLGRSPETNRRILAQALQVMESKAKRGADAARELEDEFAAQDIEKYMSMELEPDKKYQPPPQQNRRASDKMPVQDDGAVDWSTLP